MSARARRAIGAVLLCALGSCTGDERRPPPRAPGLYDSDQGLPDITLTPDSVPRAAMAALHTLSPRFVPFRLDDYSADVLGRYDARAGEGVSVLRGDFHGTGTTGYALAGAESVGTRRARAIVALVPDSTGRWRAEYVARDDTLPVLALHLGAAPEPAAGIRVYADSSSPHAAQEYFVWDRAQRRWYTVNDWR